MFVPVKNLYASHLNRDFSLGNAFEVFESTLVGVADRARRDIDEFQITDPSVVIRPIEGTLSRNQRAQIGALMSDAGAKVQIIEEAPEVHTVRVTFPGEYTDGAVAGVTLEDAYGALEELGAWLDDWWDDGFDWAVEWEMDEDVYDRAA